MTATCRLRDVPLPDGVECMFERGVHIFVRIGQSAWHVLSSPGKATLKEWLITAVALVVAFGLTYIVTALVFVMMFMKNNSDHENNQVY